MWHQIKISNICSFRVNKQFNCLNWSAKSEQKKTFYFNLKLKCCNKKSSGGAIQCGSWNGLYLSWSTYSPAFCEAVGDGDPVAQGNLNLPYCLCSHQQTVKWVVGVLKNTFASCIQPSPLLVDDCTYETIHFPLYSVSQPELKGYYEKL